MDEEMNFEEYIDEIGGEFVTADMIREIESNFPNANLSLGNVITGEELYQRVKDRLMVEAQSENWSVVAGLAEDLEEYDNANDNAYFESDADIDSDPITVDDII